MSEVAEALTTIGLYGKIPAERDFVRVNSGSFQRAGLDRWFQEGMEHLHGERTRLPPEPTNFLLFSADSAHPFVGVFAPGTDAVGRTFPVIVSMAMETGSDRTALSMLPMRLASFLDAGAKLALGTQGLAATQTAAQVATLAASAHLVPPELDRDALLSGSRLVELRAALDSDRDGTAYALTTVVAACSQVKATQSSSSSRVLTLDCPAPSTGLQIFWLELVLRHLKGELPSLFWSPTSGRLLITLGHAPSLVLAYLANPDHKSSRRWPLHTLNQTAHTNAIEHLSPAQARILASGETTLAEVLTAFSEV